MILTQPNDRPLRQLRDVAQWLLVAQTPLVLDAQQVNELRRIMEAVTDEARPTCAWCGGDMGSVCYTCVEADE